MEYQPEHFKNCPNSPEYVIGLGVQSPDNLCFRPNSKPEEINELNLGD
jgi:hypothetical protein